MAITVGNYSSAFSDTSVNTINVAKPSGGVVGDVYAIFVAAASGSITGFTKVVNNTAVTYATIQAFVKDHDGTEGANFTFSTGTFGSVTITCIIIKGSTGASAVTFNSAITAASFVNANVTKAITTGNITTTSGQFVLACMGSSSGGGTSGTATITPFSGFTSTGASATRSNALGTQALYYKTETGGTTNYSGTISWTTAANFEAFGVGLVFSEPAISEFIVARQYANGAFQALQFIEGAF